MVMITIKWRAITLIISMISALALVACASDDVATPTVAAAAAPAATQIVIAVDEPLEDNIVAPIPFEELVVPLVEPAMGSDEAAIPLTTSDLPPEADDICAGRNVAF